MQKNLELFSKFKIFHKIKNINASKILYIDDCITSCLIAKKILILKGYLVEIENDVDFIFKKVEKFIPDIIIISINSSSYNAIDVLNLIQKKLSKRNFISIAITNYLDKYDYYKISFYFDFLISKPIESKIFDFLDIGNKIYINNSKLKKVEKKTHLQKIYYAYDRSLESHKNLYKKSLEQIIINCDEKFKNWLNYIKERKI